MAQFDPLPSFGGLLVQRHVIKVKQSPGLTIHGQKFDQIGRQTKIHLNLTNILIRVKPVTWYKTGKIPSDFHLECIHTAS